MSHCGIEVEVLDTELRSEQKYRALGDEILLREERR